METYTVPSILCGMVCEIGLVLWKVNLKEKVIAGATTFV
jgi:hypothetical protein